MKRSLIILLAGLSLAGLSGAAAARDDIRFSISIGTPAHVHVPTVVYHAPPPVHYVPSTVYYHPAPVVHTVSVYERHPVRYISTGPSRDRHWRDDRGHGRKHKHHRGHR